MMNTVITTVVTLLAILQHGTGFRLNDFQEKFDNDDYTLFSIIRQGTLQAIISHAIKSNPALGPPPARVTEASVLHWVYGEPSTTEKLDGAIMDIIDASMFTCSNRKWLDDLGFLEDNIKDGHAMLQALRHNLDAKLSDSGTGDTGSVRAMIGIHLCGLVSFYGNTNWVPSIVPAGENSTYRTLGIPGANIEYYIADKDYPTCKSCSGDGLKWCAGNLLTGSGTLTSIYRDENYPDSRDIGGSKEGKCGKDYTSGDELVRGGIDKSSAAPARSPHWFHHNQAAKIAIQAVNEFFTDDEFGVFPNGDHKLNLVLGLSRGRDLLFAIDTTGSMGKEIIDVRQRTIDIAETSAGTPDAPRTYTLVEFNDPIVKKAFTTYDVSEFAAKIGGISANGGGDCPEMAMTGMIEALKAAEAADSTLFVFTDAPAKDHPKEGAVVAMALVKGVSIVIFVAVSSGCGMDDAESKAVYRRIADATGGEIFFSNSDAEFTEMLSLVDRRSLGGQAIIYQKTITVRETVTFNVDASVKTLYVVVSSEIEITQTVQLQMGSTGEFVSGTRVSGTMITFEVDVVGTGSWSLSVTGGGESFRLEVRVSGRTETTVSFGMYKETEDGTVIPITGTPDAGATVTVHIDFRGADHIAILRYIRLLSTSSELIARYKAYLKGDGSGVATIVYPNQPFTIEVEAEDADGNVITRMDAAVRVPDYMKLTTPDTTVHMYTNETKKIEIMVKNSGDTDLTFTIEVEDGDDIVDNVDIPGSASVPAHTSKHIYVYLYAPVNSSVGFSAPTFTALTPDGARASLILDVVITERPPPIIVAPRPTTDYPSGADRAGITATALTFMLTGVTMVALRFSL